MRTRTYTRAIRRHTHIPRTLRAHALVRPSRRIADTHAFCNETVQITVARTAMHVIMNAGRLFVSVPSAGNIGHFEFSIFNALVSPFGALLPLGRPSAPFPPVCSMPHHRCCVTSSLASSRVHVARVRESAGCTRALYTAESPFPAGFPRI